ncbi:ammonium transporter, partial [Vibrio vulnificus]|nr:ammonium transporter [Vibrio vulnificus]
AAGIFGQSSLGGLGRVSFTVQLLGTLLGILVALIGAGIVYGTINRLSGLRLSQEDEFNGADLAIHKISSVNAD